MGAALLRAALVAAAIGMGFAAPVRAIEGAHVLGGQLVPLPVGWQAWVEEVDAYLPTHLHSDHVDGTGRRMMDRSKPLLCQPEDVERWTADGFTNLLPIDRQVDWEGISITLTDAQHGSGEIATMLAPVSGFVLSAEGEPVLYIAGDTIWYEEVERAIERYRPAVIIASGLSILWDESKRASRPR